MRRTVLIWLLLGVALLASPEPAGLVFRLSEESSPAVTRAIAPVPEPLSRARVAELLGLLPPQDPEKKVGLAFREGPKAPLGDTVLAPWPPPERPEVRSPVALPPLKVVRRAPEGPNARSPRLTVTFSRAQESAARPVKLTPEPPGRWRWLGNRTLVFEPTAGRFPYASTFQVEALGVSWEFSTPAPQLINLWPRENLGRQPVLALTFDQETDPEQVVALCRVQVASTPEKTVAMRLATPEEVAAEPELEEYPEKPGRPRVYLVPRQPLELGTTYSLQLGEGLASSEGPTRSPASRAYDFSTYGPLEVTGRRAESSGIRLDFSNRLDDEAFQEESIQTEPRVEARKVRLWGSTLWIEGASPGQKVRVRLPASLTDIYGQKLGKQVSLDLTFPDETPNLEGPSGELVTLRQPRLSLVACNLDAVQVRLFAVQPFDWEAYLQARKRWAKELPGKLVEDRVVRLDSGPNQKVALELPLDAAMTDGKGMVLVALGTPGEDVSLTRSLFWVQVTDLAVDGVSDAASHRVWVTHLEDGGPVAGAIVSAGKVSGTTAEDGTVRLPALDPDQPMVVRSGPDTCLVPDASQPENPGQELRWYALDDRGLYRPGETARIKGWVRQLGAGPYGDLGRLPPDRLVSYELTDGRYTQIAHGETGLTPLGGFDLSLPLPQEANLGRAILTLRCGEESFRHDFQIEEFRRPEFEVKADFSQPRALVGESATARVRASYYSGGGLSGAETTWTVQARPASYRPPGREDYRFDGVESPAGQPRTLTGRTGADGTHRLHIDFDRVEPGAVYGVTAEARVQDLNHQTWSQACSLLVHPASVCLGVRPTRGFFEAGQPVELDFLVCDLDGRAVANRPVEGRLTRLEWRGGKTREMESYPFSGRSSAEHPLRLTLAVPKGGYFQLAASTRDERGREYDLRSFLWLAGGSYTGPDSDQVTLVPDRTEYLPRQTARVLVQAPFFPCQGRLILSRSGVLETRRFRMEGPSTVLEIPIHPGYVPNLYATVELLGKDRQARGQLELPVAPAERALKVSVRPEKTALRPGDETTLEVRLTNPAGQNVAGEVCLAVADEAVLGLSDYQVLDPMQTFYQAWEEGTRSYAGQRQAGPTGKVWFPAHRITMSFVKADLVYVIKVLAKEMHMNVFVGPEVEGSVTIELVDISPEAALKQVLDRFGYDFKRLDDQRTLVVATPDKLTEIGDNIMGTAKSRDASTVPRATAGITPGVVPSGPSSDTGVTTFRSDGLQMPGYTAPALVQPRLRANFDALALFEPNLRTDTSGRVRVRFKLPDNLTRYRIYAVAAAGPRQFGKGEGSLAASLPFTARPSPPRFLNVGDRAELPVVLQNQTDRSLSVEVVARAQNARLEREGFRLQLAAHQRAEVRFPVSTESPGTAAFQVGAFAAGHSDAAAFRLPVWTPIGAEAFATYGELDQGALAQPVEPPQQPVHPLYGGLELTTSPTILSQLADAVLYLERYPYECNEQRTSRMLATLALEEELAAFQVPDLPSQEELRQQFGQDFKLLESCQNEDGGFGFWPSSPLSDPLLSVHVAHLLVRCSQKGRAVPGAMLDKSRGYLRRFDPDEDAFDRRALVAYALYVRWLDGDPDVERATDLVEKAGPELSVETLGWLLPLLKGTPQADTARRLLLGRLVETAGAAHFNQSYAENSRRVLLASEVRADAVALEGLLLVDPDSELAPKLVRGLLAHRRHGRWSNTQENVFALLALDRYFRLHEKEEPNFQVAAWLGQRFAGQQSFPSRKAPGQLLQVPMGWLLDQGKTELVLDKSGPGRLYYRLGLRYAPADLVLGPEDNGFLVERSYEAVDDPQDVRRTPQGWEIRSGARVKVNVTVTTDSYRSLVAVVDPVPAGFEPINPELVGTESLPRLECSRWFDHRNMRDHQVEAFASSLPADISEFEYVARATTPGQYLAPPARAEEMYAPETFGHSRTDRVVVR